MTEARDRYVLAAVLAAALLLRLPGHLDSGLWFDEIWMLVDTIRQPFATFYTTFGSDNNHPFYSLLAWISVHSLGESAWALRLPALLFGVASVGMLWIFAQRVAPRTEAAIATTLLTISYHHVWFSQNARGYTMLLFWTLAATYYLLRVFDGEDRRSVFAYAVCLAAATYSHSSALAVAFAHGCLSLAVMANGVSRARLRHWWSPLSGLVLAGALSLLLHASILRGMIEFFTRSSAGELAATAAVPDEWNSLWWTLRAVVGSLGLGLGLGLAALTVAGLTLAIGTLEYLRRDWRVAVAFVLPPIFGLALTMGLDRPVRPRFFFNLAGFVLLILVAGVFRVCRWVAAAPGLRRTRSLEGILRGAAVVGMVGASLAILPRAYSLPKQDFKGAREWVERFRTDEDVVLTAGLAVLPYQRYYGDPYPEVRTAAGLDSALVGMRAAYVLHTLPIFLASRSPDLFARLNSATEVARFRGSLGEGDVVVLRIDGQVR